MRYPHLLAPTVLVLFIATAQAQLRNGPQGMGSNVGNVHVHVVLTNDRHAGGYLKVQLMEGSTDMVLGTSYTNDSGEVEFSGVPVGDYHVQISGDGIQTTDSEIFEVDNRKVTQAEYVPVREVEDTGPRPVSAHSSMVSATDLNVSNKARKELDKANEAMVMQNYKKAMEHMNVALQLAPKYATAYNNLGVLYARMNDLPHEEEALKKAVELDDHFAPALLNYGKLCLQQKNFPLAEQMLQKDVTVEPDNALALMLLADAEYMNRHFDVAIVNAKKAHTVSRDHPSFTHYIAARAYQQENQQPQALAEFQQFLKEEPKGPRADHVRGDIAKIQAAQQEAKNNSQ